LSSSAFAISTTTRGLFCSQQRTSSLEKDFDSS
jgi:hypothetical protein